MSKIKSALELALERTADVEIDKEAVRRDEVVNKGKILVGQFLNDPEDIDLEKQWQEIEKKEAAWLREGMLDILLSNFTLPRYETDMLRLRTISKGLQALAGKGSAKKNIGDVMDQCQNLFKQYMENVEQLEESLRLQWEPRMRQKEELLRQQTGQSFKLSPDQDPEFAKSLSEHLAELDAQYNEVIRKGRMEIRRYI
ncbi:MAG: hypothetical protein B6D68_03765 [spirochete symbiont of Stewartia floridana]|nr:MAG: hypothetical protein B6D68_03765 [spirochete symbiont of Stewartia floridana]